MNQIYSILSFYVELRRFKRFNWRVKFQTICFSKVQVLAFAFRMSILKLQSVEISKDIFSLHVDLATLKIFELFVRLLPLFKSFGNLTESPILDKKLQKVFLLLFDLLVTLSKPSNLCELFPLSKISFQLSLVLDEHGFANLSLYKIIPCVIVLFLNVLIGFSSLIEGIVNTFVNPPVELLHCFGLWLHEIAKHVLFCWSSLWGVFHLYLDFGLAIERKTIFLIISIHRLFWRPHQAWGHRTNVTFGRSRLWSTAALRRAFLVGDLWDTKSLREW